MRTRSSLATAALLALLLTACGADEGAPTVDPGAGSDAGLDGDAVTDGTDEGGTDEDGTDAVDDGAELELEGATQAAVTDLAADTGVAEQDVEVVSADRVTWSDGSLGCPEPGQVYTQALVPGYRIVLRVGGDEVHYHGAEGAAPARCDDPQPPTDPGV